MADKKHGTTRSKPLAQGRLREKEIRRQKKNGVKRKRVQGVLARHLGNVHQCFLQRDPARGAENLLRPRHCKTTARQVKREHFSKYQEVKHRKTALRRK